MIFKPEDFLVNKWSYDRAELCAVLANNILNKLIESSPVVYGSIGSIPKTYEWSTSKLTTDTHKARLMFVEQIKREPCKHEPQIRFDGTQSKENPYYFEPMGLWCKHCGVELQATWSEVKKCEHKNTRISEPHLAGARRCNDCEMYYNPNMGGWVKKERGDIF